MDRLSIALLCVMAFVFAVLWFVEWDTKAAARERREKSAKRLSSSEEVTFHYCEADRAPGVTRQTVQRLATQIGIDENQVIHQALYELATRCAVLPRQR
jgi:hypothetical protein